MVRLALFMKVNTKKPQIEHCPCPKYGMIYKPDMCNLQVRQKHLKKKARVKIHLSNNATIK